MIKFLDLINCATNFLVDEASGLEIQKIKCQGQILYIVITDCDERVTKSLDIAASESTKQIGFTHFKTLKEAFAVAVAYLESNKE